MTAQTQSQKQTLRKLLLPLPRDVVVEWPRVAHLRAGAREAEAGVAGERQEGPPSLAEEVRNVMLFQYAATLGELTGGRVGQHAFRICYAFTIQISQ